MRRACVWQPVILLALVALVLPISACQPIVTLASAFSAQTRGGSEAIEENVPYGPEPLRLDIYKPADRGTGSRPAVVLIHGGGWTSFEKSTTKSTGAFLARSGFVAFAVDYRLLHGTENRWPAQLDDVQRAVRWIRANADKYGVNAEKFGAFGHSAGAQLASVLGMEDTRDNSNSALAKYRAGCRQWSTTADQPTSLETPIRRAWRSCRISLAEYAKHPEIWQNASPVFHVSKTNAPFLIVHGTDDQDVPLAQAQELYEKAEGCGSAGYVSQNRRWTYVSEAGKPATAGG